MTLDEYEKMSGSRATTWFYMTYRKNKFTAEEWKERFFYDSFNKLIK